MTLETESASGSTSRLLQLPSELRRMILLHLLYQREPLTIVANDNPKSKTVSLNFNFSVRVMLACRQLNVEGSTILSDNVIGFYLRAGHPSCCTLQSPPRLDDTHAATPASRWFRAMSRVDNVRIEFGEFQHSQLAPLRLILEAEARQAAHGLECALLRLHTVGRPRYRHIDIVSHATHLDVLRYYPLRHLRCDHATFKGVPLQVAHNLGQVMEHSSTAPQLLRQWNRLRRWARCYMLRPIDEHDFGFTWRTLVEDIHCTGVTSPEGRCGQNDPCDFHRQRLKMKEAFVLAIGDQFSAACNAYVGLVKHYVSKHCDDFCLVNTDAPLI